MKNAKELTQEVTKIRQRARELSGFWISELAAALYAIEWAAGKRERAPSADIGLAGGEHGKIADRLLHAVSAAPVKKMRVLPSLSPRKKSEADKGSSVKKSPSPRPSPRRGEEAARPKKK
jgi:hypothetical protein